MTSRIPDDVPFASFVALDDQCVELLAAFYEWLKSDGGAGLTSEEASPLAHEADRYLRDFLVEFKERGPRASDASTVAQYLGNWYIIHTLEPSVEEIDRIAHALALLYRYMLAQQALTAQAAEEVIQRLERTEFFHSRLEAFWELTPETIAEWRSVDDYREDPLGPLQ